MANYLSLGIAVALFAALFVLQALSVPMARTWVLLVAGVGGFLSCCYSGSTYFVGVPQYRPDGRPLPLIAVVLLASVFLGTALLAYEALFHGGWLRIVNWIFQAVYEAATWLGISMPPPAAPPGH